VKSVAKPIETSPIIEALESRKNLVETTIEAKTYDVLFSKRE